VSGEFIKYQETKGELEDVKYWKI